MRCPQVQAKVQVNVHIEYFQLQTIKFHQTLNFIKSYPEISIISNLF